MAQALAALGMESLTGVDAKTATLAKLEAFVDNMDAELARRKSNGLLRRALKAWKRGNIPRAAKLSLEAVKEDETNAKAYHILAMALDKMGHRYKALVTYEKSYQLDPNDPELLINLGLIAWKLKMSAGAERLFRQHIDACPDSPIGYNNLGSIQSEMGNPDVAIEILRAAIYRMPAESILWNSLATVLAEEGRVEESLVFYHEAIALEPEFSRLHHNTGYAYMHLSRFEEALQYYDKSLQIVTDPDERLESLHSRSICLMSMGRIEEGFREYEVRNNPRFRGFTNYMLKVPLWCGEPLEGKRFLAVGEQGLGDEIMFANILPDLARAVGANGKLQIAVDPRLVPLFQRSYPEAVVGAYADRMLLDKDGNKELRFMPFLEGKDAPDYYAQMGSVLPELRKRIEDFPHQAFLNPDPERVRQYRAAIKPGEGPAVGICWRSMLLSMKRSKYFSTLDMWGPILKIPGIRFVNVQYGDCADELARACALHGVDIQVIDGLNLKDDLEGAAALSAALDLVISAPTAAAALAGSVGTETWFLTAGQAWPQLGTGEYPWYRKSRAFVSASFADWNESIGMIGDALSEYAAGYRMTAAA